MPSDGGRATWALSYLRGSADGYWRGTVSMRRVVGAVRLALRHGVPAEDIRRVLTEQRLDWTELLRLITEFEAGVRS